MACWGSDRYWKTIAKIASTGFDARRRCGLLCLQHKVNEFLWDLKKGMARLPEAPGPPPMHVNFI
ncbi:MAG: hypothetical protein JRF59_01520 [Deltaproteobacteria bacterium]|nr:hypothetical protein [Deltaproteobacteria bacterium]MBW1922260.1 hypothetical protein [Deltaproteobacteria bacterium]MBW1949535.1 hypothetical protein [Deltaproteobacteria bacterium]MBW2008414.1 hypothetical protein [Deltaproteobacteria bacterium]MBW2102176.1 hypothetical protein [Deltaproteobacteria bacterium]